MSPSFSRTMGALAASVVFPSIAHAAQTYQLQNSWEGQNILSHFDFFDRADPTNGFVTYVNQSYGEDAGLVKITETGSLYLGVDYDSVLTADGPGRESVRIESNEYFDQGLYVVDIQHMPGSICGTWPAFWTVGPNWPYDGEIDIIEGVNMHEANKIVLHTSGSCDVGGDHDMSGELTSSECGEASGTIGCVVEGQQGSSGTPFNKQGGGVYAMEWQKEYLKIWFFPRNAIPATLTAGKPDVSTFGTPMAHLQGSCNFEERFTHQKLILDTTFCGDWAGAVYGDSGCPISDPGNPMQSCVNYVAQNPADFKNAYWELNSIKIFQLGTADEGEVTTMGTIDSIESIEADPEPTTSATESKPAAEETVLPVTSTSVVTKTETSTRSTTEAATEVAAEATESAAEPVPEPTTTKTKTTAPAPSAVESIDSVPVSKVTSYVTVKTTICPIESLQTAAVVPEDPAPSAEASIETIPAPSAEPSIESNPAPSAGASIGTIPAPVAEPTETTATPTPEPVPTTETSVDAEVPPATTETPIADISSIPPGSVIYTAPDESSSVAQWEIVASSSAFVTLPTVPTSASPDDNLYTPNPEPTGTPVEPSSPVFTGMANRLSISASAIVGALALMLLA
ncbi:concanavalin A-like lectin/glucanase domain-containing protein [Aspergillus karnatakaensis]|uniref:putative GPI anchored endo-1,3(4)-beta-glucanase n=1 Tax=Aspergillus karnatakaensis TaxID=1810916 RepID=UPI003CCD8E12